MIQTKSLNGSSFLRGEQMDLVIQILILALGFGLLVKGADLFVDGSAAMALSLGIPEIVIGLTIVAMGTSAPEAAVSITGALKGSADISIGNVIGSNIMNILLILGIASTIVSIKVKSTTVKYEMPFLVLISLVFVFLGMDGTITRADGMILVLLFALYLMYMFILIKRDDSEMEDDEIKQKSVPVCILFIVIGIALIVVGSRFAVDAACEIARQAGMSERLIGLTIVALGTSLPELFTSVTAAVRGNADLAIGNIVGSNIFNILFVIGLSSLVVPIGFQSHFIYDALFATGCAALLFLFSFRDRLISRMNGLAMIAAYVIYFIFM